MSRSVEKNRENCRRYYAAHRQESIDRSKRWAVRNRKKHNERQMQYYRQRTEERRLELLAYVRERYARRTEAQKEKERAAKREYERKQRESGTERSKRRKAYNAAYIKGYYERNKRSIALSRKRYDEAHKAERAAYMKEWTKQNRVRVSLLQSKRRALKRAAATNLKGMRQFVEGVRSKPFAYCYYCQARVPSNSVHLDHIVALSKGGAHSVDNLCVSCSACNLSKGAKPLLEWARDNATQQLLNL